VATANPWDDFDAGCVGECCRYNRRLDDWNRPFGFMQQNPMAWVGLIQAYLLMAIIAALLVLGSGQVNARKWNVVGALAHCAPLIAALSSLDVFESMGALGIVRVAIAFHFFWLCLETFAALYPDPSHIR
jgi:hypothetical protein